MNNQQQYLSSYQDEQESFGKLARAQHDSPNKYHNPSLIQKTELIQDEFDRVME